MKQPIITTSDEEAFLKKTYMRRFHQYENERLFRISMWKILVDEYFQQFIPRDSTVLDIPCGYGEFITNIIAKQKIAIDLNPESGKYIPRNVKFLQCSSDHLQLQDASVDVIFVSNFFEHINHEVLRHTLEEFFRVLRPHGKVMVLQPNIRFLTKDYWMFFDHINPVDDRALDEIFEICGMKLEMKIERFLPYTTKSRVPKNLNFIKLYLHLPILWRFMGKQSFLIFRKNDYKELL